MTTTNIRTEHVRGEGVRARIADGQSATAGGTNIQRTHHQAARALAAQVGLGVVERHPIAESAGGYVFTARD